MEPRARKNVSFRLAPAMLLVALLFPSAGALAAESEPSVEPAPVAVPETPLPLLCLLFGEGEDPVEPTVAVCGYLYDPVGNVTGIVDASQMDSAKTVAYTYDDLNRLVSATATGVAQGQPYSQAFTYDAIGNITSGPAGSYAYAGHQGTSYANPHAATQVGPDALTYDHNGNLLTKGANNSYAWDYQNRLASSATGVHASAYSYDASGQRVKLVEDGVTTVFPSGGYEITAGVPTKQIEANGVTVATVVGTGANAVPRYVHTDHLTGSNLVTSSTGAVDEFMDYYPYGGIRIDQKAGTFNERRKYAGHEFDQATGLSYMKARYYDAAIGRFLSQDPVFLAIGDAKQLGDIMDKMGKKDGTGPNRNDQNKDRVKQLEKLLSDPQKLNGYSYASNNPLKYNDPTGNGPELAALLIPGVGEALIAAGGVAIAAVAVGVDAMRNGTFGRNNPAPNIFNSTPPDDTNPAPNGMPPSKIARWVTATLLGIHAVKEVVDAVRDTADAWIKSGVGLGDKKSESGKSGGNGQTISAPAPSVIISAPNGDKRR